MPQEEENVAYWSMDYESHFSGLPAKSERKSGCIHKQRCRPMFSKFVADQLKHYVYRLIDPRNGETFYIGKGVGGRVFEHVRGELGTDAEDDVLSDKLRRIRQIRIDGFEVAHVIHRHGLSEEQAFEVEAALIDAYPEVTNEVAGHGSDERGLMHAKQINERYEAKQAVFRHTAVLITINRSAAESESIYAAVRHAWKLDPKKAATAQLVMAVQQGLIVGVFIAREWLPATVVNFPALPSDMEGRWGFIGEEAPEEIMRLYLRTRIPDELRKRGAANPVRYILNVSTGS